MSGGSFNYAYLRVDDFVSELKSRMEDAMAITDLDSKVDTKLIEIRKQAQKTADLMKEVEWLFSGDTGNETFLERVKQIEERMDLE